MAIAVLSDLKQELGRLSAAGVKLAAGDFRLKNLLPALEQAAQSAPVFGKMAKLCGDLVAATAETAAKTFLELLSLVYAVSYTAGDVQGLADAQIAQPAKVKLPMPLSYRRIEQVRDLLTKSGAGRSRQVEALFAEGLEKDVRLLPLLLHGLGEYYEVADAVEKEFKTYAPYLSDWFPRQLDDAIERDDARLQRMFNIYAAVPGNRFREYLLKALAEGKTETRVTAIEVIRSYRLDDAVELLKPYVDAKEQRVKDAAQRATKDLTPTGLQKLFKKISGK